LNGAPVLSAAKRSRREAIEPFERTQGGLFGTTGTGIGIE
jgi:hypothetical protein